MRFVSGQCETFFRDQIDVDVDSYRVVISSLLVLRSIYGVCVVCYANAINMHYNNANGQPHFYS